MESLEQYSPEIAQIVRDICEALTQAQEIKEKKDSLFEIATTNNGTKTTTTCETNARADTINVTTIREQTLALVNFLRPSMPIHDSKQTLKLRPSGMFLDRPQFETQDGERTMPNLEIREIDFAKIQTIPGHHEANIEYLTARLKEILEEIRRATEPENIIQQQVLRRLDSRSVLPYI